MGVYSTPAIQSGRSSVQYRLSPPCHCHCPVSLVHCYWHPVCPQCRGQSLSLSATALMEPECPRAWNFPNPGPRSSCTQSCAMLVNELLQVQKHVDCIPHVMKLFVLSLSGTSLQHTLQLGMYTTVYSSPCDLRPLYLTIPCILRPDISGTTCIFSVSTSLYFKTTFNLRPYFAGWTDGLKSQGPLYIYIYKEVL